VTKPDLFALFRYRNLVAETLHEHRELIKSNGHCWWGWWRRPNEGDRLEFWSRLVAELEIKGTVDVGLFDSGTKDLEPCVYRATITKVIEPPNEDSAHSPTVPETEQGLIPQYYRQSPFSRAWLKLSKIELVAEFNFFTEYSYREPPPLKGIPGKYLDHLKDKAVFDSDELRAMDTTIWEIRTRLPDDRKERFLAPSVQVTSAVSAEPIPLKRPGILHLSDLHFSQGRFRAQHAWDIPGETQSTNTLALAIPPEIKDRTGAIFITGDFTFCASKEEFEQARKCIFSLIGPLDISPQHIVMIPGNHDMKRTLSEGEKFGSNGVSAIPSAPAETTENYREFYKNLLSHKANDELSMGRRFVLPSGICLDVCALNSSNLEAGANYLPGMGRVGPGAFQRVRTALRWDDRSTSAIRILMLHHHLTATEDIMSPSEYSKGFGMAVDAKAIIREAAQHGVHLALHGHRHQPFVWRESVYSLPEHTVEDWDLGEVSIVGAGSAGSTEVSDDSHHFHFFDFSPGSVSLEMFRSKKLAGFKRTQSWTADLSIEAGGLRLGKWKLTPRGDK
jgi:predicted MPP superfamily phosphohydrolase